MTAFTTKDNKSILIADDQPEIIDSILEYLTDGDEDYDLLLASDGNMACEIAQKRQPDLILMDWEMPVLSGIDALIRLKKSRDTKHIPIIMATGRTDSNDLKYALDAGAADYIKKPIEQPELLARVNSCLKLSTYVHEIKYANDALKELHREKDGVLGIVAHDLMSPLNKLKGLIGLLTSENNLSESQLEYIGLMNKVIGQGSHLIDDLLYLYSIENQSAELSITTVDLKEFIHHLIALYDLELNRKKIKLDVVWNSKLEKLKSDQNIMARILDNLISNAIKFSKPNTSILFSIHSNNKNIQFSLADQGPGISPEDQKLLFRKFQKLSAQPTGGESSNGLGLSIVRALVDRLKGSIEVQSEVGVGSEFKVSFPLDQ